MSKEYIMMSHVHMSSCKLVHAVDVLDTERMAVAKMPSVPGGARPGARCGLPTERMASVK